MRAASTASLPATGAAMITGQVGIALATLAAGFIVMAIPQVFRRTKAHHRP